jgi:hypothetical protein
MSLLHHVNTLTHVNSLEKFCIQINSYNKLIPERKT